MNEINVYSEIGKLKTVLLHRPGRELENLTPDYLDELLFDDIPYLKQAQVEHDNFANLLRSKGIEVLYLENLAAESLINEEVKEQFIDQFLYEAKIKDDHNRKLLKDFFLNISDMQKLIDLTMAGISKSDLDFEEDSFSDKKERDNLFFVAPMPNLYFTRDNFSSIGKGISLNKMNSETRNRETIYGQYIFDFHPRFSKKDIPRLYDRRAKTSIEGGDQLILSKEVIAVGVSERTMLQSVKDFAQNIFREDMGFKKILAFDIGEHRKFMHLDTVFTMVDYNKFTVHPEIEDELKVYSIIDNDGVLETSEELDSLENILCKFLNLEEVILLRCGAGCDVTAAREQWNDASNTLAIAPGEVIVYDRNPVTNEHLKKAGIKLNYIPGSELVRGRGGPRCMSMPLFREDI
ncbi:arginine deiminase [Floricoccus penangensis]|uniref:Arginine deiminase n=1 Tax=Floricoccus penangensis TaxID=1859475 RepID=A0A9Q5JHC8_9LACT|nr:arginine deiminase [Floricoccus penangensis]OFI47204.1 arginine deiminase [Floricoccus penangensis]